MTVKSKIMLPEWLRAYETALWWLGALSVLTFFGTLVVIPLLVVRIPTDYFIRDRQPGEPERWSALHMLAKAVKNIIGCIFILTGIAMLVLPGQGVITILLGMMLMNFPSKRAFERRIVEQPTVLRAINWMRQRARRPPLILTKPDVPANDQQPHS